MNRLQGRAAKITVCVMALMMSFAAQAAQETQPESVPGEYIVKMKPNMGVMSQQMLSQTLKAYVKNTITDLNLVVIKRPVFETQKSVIKELSQNANVQFVEPNFIYRVNKTPNDPMLGQLWGMQNTGSADSSGQTGVAGVDVDAVKAWDIETGSKDVVVAIIDTGVRYDHEDLKNNMWTNEAELNGKPGVDDDNNGVIDDIYGANFVDATKPTGNPMDDYGHGSHCAGTIAASGDDGKGIVGVAWNARIMAVKFLSASGSGTLEGAVQAINYANKMGAKILSYSWGGGGFSQALKDVIDQSNAKGALFVAAAGNESNNNDSSPTYPATYDVPNILAVAAVNNKGTLASFSNYGKNKVHVGAPGVNVVSITMDGYESWSGTSMATPHVSGVAVLLASHEPNLTGLELKERIMKTVKPMSTMKNKVKTKGIVNAYNALMNIEPAPDMNDPVYWSAVTKEVSTAHPYADKAKQEWTVSVDGAKEISLYFAKFETETTYDYVEIFDGEGKLVQKLTGNNDDTFTNIIPGNTARIVFTADDSMTKYGFDLTKVSYR